MLEKLLRMVMGTGLSASEKLLRTAMGLGITASCLMVVDKNTTSLSARASVILLFWMSFYYWIRYLKAYIDQRIKMRDDLEKTEEGQKQ